MSASAGDRRLRLLGRPRADLHEICVARLRRAEREAAAGDIVLLSGWARHGSAASEAELMAEAWSAPCRELVVDRSARSTFANVRAAARVAREADASEVVLVTSGWHGRRAAALLRAALRAPGTVIRLATTDEPPSVSHAAPRARVLDDGPAGRAQRISIPPLMS